MNRDLFIRAGEAICGPLWQREIARRLGVSERSVRYWIAGRPIPAGVWADLRVLAEAQRAELCALLADLDRGGDAFVNPVATA